MPGSTRSGLNAMKTSSPTTKPRVVNDGSSTSRVVPGYVVLSSTTSMPAWACRVAVSAAEITYDMSGSRVFDSGVGTAMEIASVSPSRVSSVVAVIKPLRTSAARSALGTSWMCESPAMSRETTRSLMS